MTTQAVRQLHIRRLGPTTLSRNRLAGNVASTLAEEQAQPRCDVVAVAVPVIPGNRLREPLGKRDLGLPTEDLARSREVGGPAVDANGLRRVEKDLPRGELRLREDHLCSLDDL